MGTQGRRRRARAATPFSYVTGPFYTYELSYWVPPDKTRIEVIYVGKGRGHRAKVYYRFRARDGSNRYNNPRGHNPELDEKIKQIRAAGGEVLIHGFDHLNDSAACHADERRRIRLHGRIGITPGGTLYNRTW
jgi:hypothetical protein